MVRLKLGSAAKLVLPKMLSTPSTKREIIFTDLVLWNIY